MRHWQERARAEGRRGTMTASPSKKRPPPKERPFRPMDSLARRHAVLLQAYLFFTARRSENPVPSRAGLLTANRLFFVDSYSRRRIGNRVVPYLA